MSKLLWHSNAPFSPTGYGQQTALFLPRLKEHFDLGCSAFYGLEGDIIPWNGVPIFPGLAGTYGDHHIRSHAKAFFGELRNGLVVTLMDVWALDPTIWRDLNVAAWCPVDHRPAPPMVRDFFELSGAVPIAMSRFGEQQLEAFDPLYCPHAVDTKVYKPVSKDEAREQTKIPKGAFVVGMVAANKGSPSRKCFPQAFLAFKAFHDRHPDSVLYVHSGIHHGRGLDANAIDLAALLKGVGLPPESVAFANQDRVLRYPFKPEIMAAVYSSLDVLLAPSAGEGFGLPVLEANACGVPAIVTDFSAQPEVNGAGWTVEYRPQWSMQKSWQADPDVEDITDALNRAYSIPAAGRKELAEKARQHALGYDVEKVLVEHMLPALESAGERFEERKPVGVVERTRKANAKRQKVAA